MVNMENETSESKTQENNDATTEDASNDTTGKITEPEHIRKLFIGGLDYKTTDETLKAHFEQWGEIVDVVVMKDPKTKRSRGFGFITYSKSTEVDEAQNNRPHKVDGRTVEPKRAVPRTESGRPDAGASIKKLFIGGIKDEHTEEDLREYFKQFGNIVTCSVVVDKDSGKKKGFAFVEYDDYDPVDKACLQKNHTVKGKHLDVKKAHGKDQRNSGAGGGRSSGGSWGGNGRGTSSFGGRGNQGGGFQGGWGNGSGWGDNQGSWGAQSWANQGGWSNDSFGNNYQQNMGGGPARGSTFGANRSTPYGGNFGTGRRY